jgi:hypothetical protein
MVMTAVDMINRYGGQLDEKTVRDEPRRQYLSVHRLPQHRQGHPRRRRRRCAAGRQAAE